VIQSSGLFCYNASIMKEGDFGTQIVSAERGDIVDFGAKCAEMAANALLKHLKLAMSTIYIQVGKAFKT